MDEKASEVMKKLAVMVKIISSIQIKFVILQSFFTAKIKLKYDFNCA